MKRHTRLFPCAVAALMLMGCAFDGDDMAKRMIAEMDAKPPDQRLPNWDVTRALMLREPPSVGDPAPVFTLPTRDGNERISLADFKSKKPVVLIFGSWT